MVQFICDSCGSVKETSDVWVLGLAAEAIGATSASREVNILSGWDRPNAVHPLAVHFCCLECEDDYVARLFSPEPVVEKTTVKRTVPIREVAAKAPSARKSGRKKSA